MPPKPVQRERYKARALRFLDKSAKSFRNMTRRYEELGRLQDYLRQHPHDTQIRAIFEQKKTAFLASNRVRDRIQQAAVAYGNYLREPGAEPILVSKKDLKKATRRYVNFERQIETNAPPRTIESIPPAEKEKPQSKQAPSKETRAAKPINPGQERLESMIRAQFNELRQTSEGGSPIAGPLLRYINQISPRAATSLHMRLKRINQLMNADRMTEAVQLFQQTSDTISIHLRKHQPRKEKVAPATNPKKQSTRWKRIKEATQKIWKRAKSPFSLETRVKRKSTGDALTLVYRGLRKKLRANSILTDAIATLRHVIENKSTPTEEKELIRDEIATAAREIDNGNYSTASTGLIATAKKMKKYVRR